MTIRILRASSLLAPALAAVLMTLALVFYSHVAFSAALQGLKLFLEVVFPSLLPFFILSEAMLALGVVHFLGVLFEPLMRPLFNVPGAGSFVLSMGLAAGYPMDAVITGKFRRAGMCTRVEAERLLAFTNTADPLFLFGAVAVGMFKSPALGAWMAAAHYLAALGVGLLFRFYGRHDTERPSAACATAEHGHLLIRAFRELRRARHEDGRPLGQILGDAVSESVKTLLMICGFILFFSVLIKVLEITGLASYLSLPVAALFRACGLHPSLVPAAFAGLLEIDVGAQMASDSPAPFIQQVMVTGGIVAWSGLSVHGQVASVLAGTDIRMGPYVLARLLHAVLAMLLTAFLLRFAV